MCLDVLENLLCECGDDAGFELINSLLTRYNLIGYSLERCRQSFEQIEDM